MRRLSRIDIEHMFMCNSPDMLQLFNHPIPKQIPSAKPTLQSPNRFLQSSALSTPPRLLLSISSVPKLSADESNPDHLSCHHLPQFSIPFHHLDVLTLLLFHRIPRLPFLGPYMVHHSPVAQSSVTPPGTLPTPSGLRLLRNHLKTLPKQLCDNQCNVLIL